MRDGLAPDVIGASKLTANSRNARKRSRIHETPAALLVAVPLYRSPELLPDLTEALTEIAPELRRLAATILFINDSPDDEALVHALELARAQLAPIIEVEVETNPGNLGFIASANLALERGLATDRDVILLNSDALPRPGAFSEMLEVAYSDPLVSVVSPRSDNATICDSPVADVLRGRGRDQDWRAHLLVAAHLPRITYVPTAVGFCLLVRRAMIAEFGLFDTIYGAGYGEENDFIRRCNQAGYRAVLANHAYVHHIGEISFAKTGAKRAERDRENHAILIARYPEYDQIISRHFLSAAHRAEHVLGGLVPVDGKLGILFDCRVMGPFFNGTFEHIAALLRAFAARFTDRFDLRVLCSEKAFRFHRLDTIPGLALWTEDMARLRPSAVAFRMSQPNAEAITTLAGYGAVTGALMLDTIAMDCQQLDEIDRHGLWTEAIVVLDLIGFNSHFTRDQFVRRFALPERTVQFVSLCSTDPAEYVPPATPRLPGSGILLVGNHFPHKNVMGMLRALQATGSTVPPVTVLGLEVNEPDVVASYQAGEIPTEVVDQLYREAAVVLFPSHYEGFGLPIMHALARGLPVIARDLPCAREIRARCPVGQNLYLCASTDEMAAMALTPPRWRDDGPVSNEPPHDWEAAAVALGEAFEEGLRRFDFAACARHQAAARTFTDAAWVQAELLGDEWYARALDAGSRGGRSDRGKHTGQKGPTMKLASKIKGFVTGRARARKREKEAVRALVMTEQNRIEGLFDPAWYLDTYPDVRQQNIDPLRHYVDHGAAEHRNPGPNFRSAFYLAMNPDVAASGCNPLIHYLELGRSEGRAPNPRSYRARG